MHLNSLIQVFQHIYLNIPLQICDIVIFYATDIDFINQQCLS